LAARNSAGRVVTKSNSTTRNFISEINGETLDLIT
jgi:hypothetical protein